jgi:hypothetical protein
MPHTGIYTITTGQDNEREREVCLIIFCCKTAAISTSFTPLSTFCFQSLSAIAFLNINVDITFHHITSQFSALTSALLAALAATMTAAVTGADDANGETIE